MPNNATPTPRPGRGPSSDPEESGTRIYLEARARPLVSPNQERPPAPDAMRVHTEHLEDLLAGIATLAERKGDPFDLSDWPGDLGESAVRRVLELEARLTVISAVAPVGPIQ